MTRGLGARAGEVQGVHWRKAGVREMGELLPCKGNEWKRQRRC